MAISTKTTKVLRHHFGLANGGTRYVDIDNPIDNATVIKENLGGLNGRLQSDFAGILVGDSFFDGDSDAVVTQIISAEIVETTKTIQTTDISLS